MNALCEEFKRRFYDLRETNNMLLHLETLRHLDPDYTDLFDEFLEMKNNTNLKVIYKENMEK